MAAREFSQDKKGNANERTAANAEVKGQGGEERAEPDNGGDCPRERSTAKNRCVGAFQKKWRKDEGETEHAAGRGKSANLQPNVKSTEENPTHRGNWEKKKKKELRGLRGEQKTTQQHRVSWSKGRGRGQSNRKRRNLNFERFFNHAKEGVGSTILMGFLVAGSRGARNL